MSYIEFWVGIGGEFVHLSMKPLNILLPFATSYLCETEFSTVTAVKTKQLYKMNLENDLRAPFKNSELDMISYVYVQSGNSICPTNPSMKLPLN
jgi:hypothetical protein